MPVNPGQLSLTHFGVQALRIPGLANLERGVDEDLREGDLGFVVDRPGSGPMFGQGADRGRNHDGAGIRHERGDVAHAPQILPAVGGGESQVRAEPMAEVVSVQSVGETALPNQMSFHSSGQRRLARAGETAHPERCPSETMGSAFGGVEGGGAPDDVAGSRGRAAHGSSFTPMEGRAWVCSEAPAVDSTTERRIKTTAAPAVSPHRRATAPEIARCQSLSTSHSSSSRVQGRPAAAVRRKIVVGIADMVRSTKPSQRC